MKEQMRGAKIKLNKGITLIALVITIIVLLILAGVSLSMVFSQDGIFSRAELATDKHGEAKARETLELALGEAQMQKYEEGLTDEQLTDKINEIGEEIEERENSDISQAIVDGYIFLVDRTVPKILDYLGPADGIIITAKVSGNGGWFKQGDTINVTVTGKIKTYSGGTVTTVSATKGGTAITGFSIDGDGRYTIENITEDTTIVISAEDSKDKKGSKTVPIIIRIDNIPPTVDKIDARTEAMKIIFSVTGTDNESGIKHFNYTITSTDEPSLSGIPENKREGTIIQGQTVEILTTTTEDREETKYKIIVTAVDNCENISEAQDVEVTTIDGITLAQAKELVNENTLQQYIGIRITDYIPEAKGRWRVFYYDADNYFGDGAGTLYIKVDGDKGVGVDGRGKCSSEGVEIYKQMNTIWREYPGSNAGTINKDNGNFSTYLCSPEYWKNYKTEDAKYAIGTPSLEMFVRAYNVYKQNNVNGNEITCGMMNTSGYGIAVGSGELKSQLIVTLDDGRRNVFGTMKGSYLASHSGYGGSATVKYETGGFSYGWYGSNGSGNTSPIAVICK